MEVDDNEKVAFVKASNRIVRDDNQKGSRYTDVESSRNTRYENYRRNYTKPNRTEPKP